MSYTEEVYERVVAQNPGEPEFHQAVKEVLDSLKVVIDKNEEEYRSSMRCCILQQRGVPQWYAVLDDQGNLIAALLVLYMPFDAGVTANVGHFAAALGMGASLTLGYLFFSIGMRQGVSSVTAAIVSYIEPILNPTWCFLFLGENPGPLSIAGALVVLAAVTGYTVLSSRRRA